MAQAGRMHFVAVFSALVALSVVLAGCAPAAAPTPTPTRAPPPPAVTPTAAPKVEPTKPPEKPAATPTPAPPAKPTGKPIKIGYVAPLSGPMAMYGVRQRIAVKLAVEDVNNGGGVNGSPLEIVTGDDAADPRQTVTLVRRLASDDRVFAVLGPLTCSAFEVAAPLANDLQTPVMTLTCGKPGVTDQNRPWSFAFSYLDSDMMPEAVRGFKKLYPDVKRVVITGDTKSATHEYIVKNVYPKALKDAGLEVIDTVPFETGTTDFAAIVTKIKGLKPDGIAFSAGTPEGMPFAKELQRQGVLAPAMAPVPIWAAPDVRPFERWVAAGFFDEDTKDPRGKALVERFVKAVEADPAAAAVKPIYLSAWAQSYDAVTVLAEIMRKNTVTPDMDLQKARTIIRDGLQGLKDFQGVAGTISMKPNGISSLPSMAFVARDGRWVLVR